MKTRIKLKVCGMRDAMNILDVAALHPDFMGFIFYRNSKRFVGDDFKIPSAFPKQIKRVGVFVNEDMENIIQKVRKHQLDYAQLHGDEEPLACKKLKSSVGVIKVFQIDESFEFHSLKPYVPFVDYFLFDTKSVSYGGSGKAFDWKLLNDYNEQVPFFLSGGLNPDNIESAIQFEHPQLFAVDVNSGAEMEPGKKDIHKLDSIFQILNSDF